MSVLRRCNRHVCVPAVPADNYAAGLPMVIADGLATRRLEVESGGISSNPAPNRCSRRQLSAAGGELEHIIQFLRLMERPGWQISTAP